MKKLYQSPIFLTMNFVSVDVITASGVTIQEWGNDKQWSFLSQANEVGEF